MSERIAAIFGNGAGRKRLFSRRAKSRRHRRPAPFSPDGILWRAAGAGPATAERVASAHEGAPVGQIDSLSNQKHYSPEFPSIVYRFTTAIRAHFSTSFNF